MRVSRRHIIRRVVGSLALTSFFVLATAGCFTIFDGRHRGVSPASPPSEKQVGGDAPLAALMYLWYGFDLDTGASRGGIGSSHWNTPGPHSAHRRGVTDEPEYGFYASDDTSVIARQLADMEEAGISVILLSWWGSGDSDLDGVKENKESEAMDRAAGALLDYISASSAPFKVAFIVEPYTSNPAGITLAQKQTILDELWDNEYSAYPDLMFHWEGKPLLVTWAPLELKSPRDPRLTVKTWGSYFGGPNWKAASGQDWNWHPEPAWLSSMISEDGVYVVFPRFDEYWLHIMGRVFPYPYRRVDPLLTEGLYEQTWQIAAANRDDIRLIVLYAWNEHKEHASIEPDKNISPASYGRSLLEKTSTYYRQFLSGSPITALGSD